MDTKKACLGRLLDSTPISLYCTDTLNDAACKAAAEGNREVMEFLLETTHLSPGELSS